MLYSDLMITAFGLIILSVIGLRLSYPLPGWGLLAWVSLIPLFLALRGKKTWQGLLIGAVFGLLLSASVTSWLVHVNPVILVVFSFYFALYFAIFGFGASVIYRQHPPGHGAIRPLFFLASLWVSLEYLCVIFIINFSWGLLGSTQSMFRPIIQIADMTGTYGVSFLVVLINAALFECIEAFRIKRSPKKVLAISLSLWTFCLLYGTIRITQGTEFGTLRASVVQGNIAQIKKWNQVYREETLAIYESLTRQAAQDHPDLIVWPETATPGYLEDHIILSRIEALARDTHIPILLGTPSTLTSDALNSQFFNSAVLFSGQGEQQQKYDKIQLVPFSEYDPFDSKIYFVRNIVPTPLPYSSPGSEHTIFQCQGFDLGVTICFEDTIPSLSRAFCKAGAHILVSLGNDAYFGPSSGPHQHFHTSIFRSVENRVPMIRASNIGLSGFIDHTGKVLDLVSDSSGAHTFIQGVQTITLNVPTTLKSFYTRFGDIFSWICVIFVITTAIAIKSAPSS